MDELDIKGKKYISSKRAAEITGYAKDYIGQLARAGKITASRFGRAWYVEESALMAHFRSENKEAPEAQTPVGGVKSKLAPHFFKPYTFPKTWGEVQYMEDTASLLPSLSQRIPEQKKNEVSEPVQIIAKNIVSSPASQIRSVASDSSNLQQGRIKILNDGIVRRSAILRVAEPNSPSTKTIEKKRTTSAFQQPTYALLPVVSLVAGFAFVLLAVSGLFIASGAEYHPLNQEYTASVLPSLEHVASAFKDSSFIQAGFTAFTGFSDQIFGSFWTFFTSGFTFIRNF